MSTEADIVSRSDQFGFPTGERRRAGADQATPARATIKLEAPQAAVPAKAPGSTRSERTRRCVSEGADRAMHARAATRGACQSTMVWDCSRMNCAT